MLSICDYKGTGEWLVLRERGRLSAGLLLGGCSSVLKVRTVKVLIKHGHFVTIINVVLS